MTFSKNMKHLPIFCVLWHCMFSGICRADSPIAAHSRAPKVSMIEAIKLVSAHLKKDPKSKDYYLSKIELVEASMVPPPRGSFRHWKVVGRRHREERAKEVVLYVGMDGRVSERPPVRKSTTGERGGGGKDK